MGLPRPPPFLDPSLTEDIILDNGVNYASGGGGILNETGGYFVSSNLKLNYIYIYIDTHIYDYKLTSKKISIKFYYFGRFKGFHCTSKLSYSKGHEN